MTLLNKSFNNNYLFVFLAAICVVYIAGWNIDVMDVDAAQYATISREMLESGDWLKVYDRGVDYLDKPPFVFWCTVISYKIFGVYNFSFKLPHFLFCLIALAYTFRLARLFYGESAARLAVLILGSTQALFLMNNDCRMDMALTAGVAMSVSYMASYQLNKKTLDLLLSFVGVGLAMLAKGPLGLMIPILAFSVDFIAKRNWKAFVDPKYILGLGIVALMLLPMCIGLYEQYGNDGLLFYFWKQSFGRLTGNNDFVKLLVEDDYVDDPTFFYHTFAWSFSPWSIMFIVAFVMELKDVWKKKMKFGEKDEVALLAGFVLTFAALSFSKYKLPHYIFELFPFAAIIMAKHWVRIEPYFEKGYDVVKEKTLYNVAKYVLVFQSVLMSLLWVVAGLLVFYCFPAANMVFVTILFFFGVILTLFVSTRYKNLFQKIFTLSLCTAIGVNFMLNFDVYPILLKYQIGGDVGRILVEKKVDDQQFLNFSDFGRAVDFYGGRFIPRPEFKNENIPLYLKKGNLLLVTEGQYEQLKTAQAKTKVIYKGLDYSVTLLTAEFLNPATREAAAEWKYLLEVE